MNWIAILPIKPRGQRKSRLSARNVDGEAVAMRLLRHVCVVMAGHPIIARTILLSSEPEDCGADTWVRDGGRGLNAELDAVRARMSGHNLLFALPDLPALASEDIDRLTAATVDGHGVAIAPDRHELGTNAIALCAGTDFAFRFGPASLASHRLQAPGAAIVRTWGLSLDVDTPEDLALSNQSPAATGRAREQIKHAEIRAGRRMSNTTELIERAKSAASLENFGDDSFREGLEILVGSANKEARFTESGKSAFDAQIVSFLVSRLQVEDWFARRPEIEDQEIIAPLIGLGLPRTGSTALGCLLAEDPHARFIRTWEALAPCPPPETATQTTDPRIAVAEQAMVRRDALFPRMKAMLPSTATGPTECQTFMGHDFKSQIFQAFAAVPTYVEWLNHKADLVPTYTYVKRVLKLLQWRCPPRRWRLKNPSHSLFIDALSQVFPDARFWMTHRDVSSVIPSVCDVYYELSKAYCDSVDKSYLGRENTEFAELGLRRLIAFRDQKGQNHRFFDIHFAPFQKNPFPILENLYAFLGETLTDEARSRMETWRENTPRDKHGSHAYEPVDFGIDLNVLRERFRFYSDRFDVRPDLKKEPRGSA